MEQLTGLRRTDAAIIGGGLTGLLLAAGLTHEGLKCTIIDAGSGLREVDTGMASFLCSPLFARIEAVHGTTAARQYAAALIGQLRALLDTPLPYVQEIAAYRYARLADERPALEREFELMLRLGIPASIAPDAGGCPFPVNLSLVAQGQALVNLPRWQAALQARIIRRSGHIYHDSRVAAIEANRVTTPQGCVEASHIILTTGMPLGLQDHSMLSLLEPHLLAHCNLKGTVPLHTCQQSIQTGSLMLIPTPLGILASWDTGRTGMRQQLPRLQQFKHAMNLNLPEYKQCEMQYTRSVFSTDGLPLIGTLPGTQLLFASGYGECSILGAMHAAQVLTRRIIGRSLPEDGLYSPTRHIPHKLLQQHKKRMRALAFRSILHPHAPHCAHCSSRMRYSTTTQHWDCPFCGSSYTILGLPASGPTLKTAQVSVRQRPDT